MPRLLLGLGLILMPLQLLASTWEMEGGGGGAHFLTPWSGVDLEQTPVPYFSARYGRWGFGVGDSAVQYDLLESELRLSVGLGYRDETYQAIYALINYESDDQVFEGYDSPSGEAAGILLLQYSLFQLQVARDLQGESEGSTVQLRANVPLYRHQSGWGISSTLGINWQEDKYATHVYGVSQRNVDEDVGRHFHSIGHAINPLGAVQLYIPIGSRHSVRGAFHYERLDRDIRSSPLVDRAYKANLTVIFVTRF